MSKRRKPSNYFAVILVAGLIGIVSYFNIVIGPTAGTLFEPTATATRDPESFITDADALLKQGKLKQAIAAYQQAIPGRPKDAAIYIAMARTQVFAGDYIDAQKSAEYALLFNPNNSTAHAVRGWALYFQNDYLDAETSIKRALELDPNNPLTHSYYAELLADEYLSGSGPLDAQDQAAAESKTALALGPSLLEPHRARGYVLEVTGNYSEAIDEYNAAIAINPNLADLYLALGRNYAVLSLNDEAKVAFSRANTLNPTDPLPSLYISRIYASIGDYANAIQYAEIAVNNAPDNAGFHGNLGMMYFLYFESPSALKELSLAVNGGTAENGVVVKPLEITASARAAEYHTTYGRVLVRLDRCGDALLIFQKILAIIPDNTNAVFYANEGINECIEAANSTQTPAVAGGSETPDVQLTPDALETTPPTS